MDNFFSIPEIRIASHSWTSFKAVSADLTSINSTRDWLHVGIMPTKTKPYNLTHFLTNIFIFAFQHVIIQIMSISKLSLSHYLAFNTSTNEHARIARAWCSWSALVVLAPDISFNLATIEV